MAKEKILSGYEDLTMAELQALVNKRHETNKEKIPGLISKSLISEGKKVFRLHTKKFMIDGFEFEIRFSALGYIYSIKTIKNSSTSLVNKLLSKLLSNSNFFYEITPIIEQHSDVAKFSKEISENTKAFVAKLEAIADDNDLDTSDINFYLESKGVELYS